LENGKTSGNIGYGQIADPVVWKSEKERIYKSKNNIYNLRN